MLEFITRHWPQNIVGIGLAAILTFNVRDLFRWRTASAYQAVKLRDLEEAQRNLKHALSMKPDEWFAIRLVAFGGYMLAVLAVVVVLYAGGFWT
jgi:hypothetical protein